MSESWKTYNPWSNQEMPWDYFGGIPTLGDLHDMGAYNLILEAADTIRDREVDDYWGEDDV